MLGSLERVGDALAHGHLGGDDVEVDAAELARRAGEVLGDEVLGQADRLEDLGTGVGRDGGDAHLGHHLQDALAQRLDVVAGSLLGLQGAQRTVAGEVLDRLHREVGVDGRRAVPDQQRRVVDLAGVAGLDDEPDVGAGLLPYEMVVHGAGQQQRRDRRKLGGGLAVGEHHDVSARRDGGADLGADALDGLAERGSPAGYRVEPADHDGAEAGQVAVVVDVDDLGQLVVVQDRELQRDLTAAGRRRVEQVALATGRRTE